MVRFLPSKHTPSPYDSVEVYVGNELVATIYPFGPNGITINRLVPCAISGITTPQTFPQTPGIMVPVTIVFSGSEAALPE